MDELRNELKNSGKEEAIAIINNITENIERINHHGKRADGIVKGMLEHSKGISGQKELTDINKLADESLRISYSSTRAKDTSFTASFETFLDDSVGEIFLVPQDIARVFLNLFNNAFYSVNEKRKLSDENFNPTVSVTTKRENNKIIIVIRDNGTGIPQKIVHKIFQPFFTTKPTGQGTGLGLSLSYSIIKAHGGEIKVESVPGESTELIIKLPIQA
jgi:signal transduction histidine kinase